MAVRLFDRKKSNQVWVKMSGVFLLGKVRFRSRAHEPDEHVFINQPERTNHLRRRENATAMKPRDLS